jgi:hypothetical protein
MPLTIEWTRTALSIPEHVRDELAARLERLHPFFPEMKERMKIGITRSYDGLAFQSESGFVKLMLEVRKGRDGTWRYPTYWTLAHELMHLAQFNAHGIPGGERACDVFALARLPPEFIDDSPSYLVVPRGRRSSWLPEDAKMAHGLAVEALELRKKGLRRYASWWETEFEARAPSR